MKSALVLCVGSAAVGASVPAAAGADPLIEIVSVTPNTGLAEGASVVVAWTGGTPDKGGVFLECARNDFSGPQSAEWCDVTNYVQFTSDGSGNGSATLNGVHSGTLGTQGSCSPTCYIALADFTQGPRFSFRPITFGAGDTTTTAAPTGGTTTPPAAGSSSTTAPPSSSGGSSTPTTTAAATAGNTSGSGNSSSGGTANGSSSTTELADTGPGRTTALLALAGALAIFVGAGALFVSRRGPTSSVR